MAESENDTHALVRQLFAAGIPFNEQLGLEVDSLGIDRAALRFRFREELVGNPVRRSLHGGVISATLDTVGGLVAFLQVLERHSEKPREEKIAFLGKIGTIDLRVDYLRSGIGNEFRATGFILRTGSRVAVTRMELHNEEQTLIAVGTGTYIVG